MSKVSKNEAKQVEKAEGFEGHYQELDGFTVGFENYSADIDMAPLFKGLPDNQCQCPHWGIVLKGKLIYHYANGEDAINAGEAYYVRPGHTPELTAGTEVVEFSPTDELKKTLEVVTKNTQSS